MTCKAASGIGLGTETHQFRYDVYLTERIAIQVSVPHFDATLMHYSKVGFILDIHFTFEILSSFSQETNLYCLRLEWTENHVKCNIF